MSSLNIRGIAPSLLKEFKTKAAMEGKTLKVWVIEKLLYVKPTAKVG